MSKELNEKKECSVSASNPYELSAASHYRKSKLSELKRRDDPYTIQRKTDNKVIMTMKRGKFGKKS